MTETTPIPTRYRRTPEAGRFLGLSGRTLEKHRSYGRRADLEKDWRAADAIGPAFRFAGPSPSIVAQVEGLARDLSLAADPGLATVRI